MYNIIQRYLHIYIYIWIRINEIENIVASGTKINIDYHLNTILDEEAQKEIYDYFLEDAESDDIKDAFDEFEGDYSEDELRLMKIKFIKNTPKPATATYEHDHEHDHVYGHAHEHDEQQ